MAQRRTWSGILRGLLSQPLVRKATVVLLYLLPARAPAPALVLLWRLVSRLAEAVGVGV